jgi:tetratricopeptide (TPR) repeat protein
MVCRRRAAIGALQLLLALLLAISSQFVVGQTGNTPAEMKQRIADLVKDERYIDAFPLLEKMIVAEPKNSQMHFYYAFALIAKANLTQDTAERKAFRVRARAEFVTAKDLGDKHPVVEALIHDLPADGSDGAEFSANKEAAEAMSLAETYFSQGKLDEALQGYQRALALDPKLYEAAVFSGDVYMHRADWEQAEIWYQKAIAIDPTQEKAYRYSATPLMKQQKYDMARDRYIEAYITEPYSRFSRAGLTQWGEMTKTPLGHPKIEIPTKVNFDEKGNAQITLDPAFLTGHQEDGSAAWVVYGGVRSVWHKETFAKTFPAEKTYRHSLNEEADALRTVLNVAAADKKIKQLSPALLKLKTLNDKGFLEAYILLAMADDGIAADYPAYLSHNRDRLRGYVMEYVITNGGK